MIKISGWILLLITYFSRASQNFPKLVVIFPDYALPTSLGTFSILLLEHSAYLYYQLNYYSGQNNFESQLPAIWSSTLMKWNLLQWWFVNPDTFVPGRYFRISEFSGLLNRPSVQTRKSVPALFVRISENSGLSEPGLTNHHCISYTSCLRFLCELPRLLMYGTNTYLIYFYLQGREMGRSIRIGNFCT